MIEFQSEFAEYGINGVGKAVGMIVGSNVGTKEGE